MYQTQTYAAPSYPTAQSMVVQPQTIAPPAAIGTTVVTTAKGPATRVVKKTAKKGCC
jgi:hypothetical protein